MSESTKSYFSVSPELITTNIDLSYDLFINSSSRSDKEKFVRIFPKGQEISDDDVTSFRQKYHQLYIPEEQRGDYLKSLSQSSTIDDVQKTDVIKDSAIQYLDKLFDETKEFSTEVLEETIGGCRDAVESMVDVIKDYKINDVQNLIGNLSFHDFYTYDHSINVSMYCIMILRAIKPDASREEIVMAGLGGMLHDLGKLRIPNSIINSPGDLTDADFAQIRKHPDYGKELLEEKCPHCEGVDFEVISRIIYEHHENYNGTGYPNKMKGEDIHLYARITAIADFFDAITTKRSYHDAMSTDEALGVMARSVGKKIDPKIFVIFADSIDKIKTPKPGLMALPDSFDPCMPHKVLPLQTYEARRVQKDVFGNKKDHGDVKFIDFPKKKKAS